MNSYETRLMNMFINHYDELVESHLIEGCTGSMNQDEINLITAGVATVLTVNHLLEERRV